MARKPGAKLLFWVVSLLFLMALLVAVAARVNHPWKADVLNWLGLNPSTKWVGKPAPDFELTNIHGRKVSLRSRHGKVVILDFWATWCPDCLRQLPMIEKLHRDPSLRGKVEVLTVHIRSNLPNPAPYLRTFMEKRGYHFPVLVGNDELADKYAIRFLPTLMIVSRQGEILYSGGEYHTEAGVRALVRRALVQ